VPSSGSSTYLTTTTPAITDGSTLALPPNPGVKSGRAAHHHASCVLQLIVMTQSQPAAMRPRRPIRARVNYLL
jgi:hypothetical protein